MNRFEESLTKHMDEKRLSMIGKVKIGIGGAGGLGSNCAFNLVRCGFKNFIIADFDVLEAANLNRQFYFLDQLGMKKVEALKENLLRINPDLNIEAVSMKIDDTNIGSIFSPCHVVVEAFDGAIYKRMLVENYYDSGKLVVSASGIAGWGNSDDIKTKKIHDSLYIIGDMESEASENLPPLSPRVNIAAAKQADVILEWVLKDRTKGGGR